MAGRWRKTALILVGALALALVAGASAASPDVAAMNLQVADVPGAKIISQHSLKENGYVSAYLREFAFAAPSGSSRLVLLETETALAPTGPVPLRASSSPREGWLPGPQYIVVRLTRASGAPQPSLR